MVSDRYFERVTDNCAIDSCGCKGETYTGERTNLWKQIPVADNGFFDFDNARSCGSFWCKTHGSEYCEAILALIDDTQGYLPRVRSGLLLHCQRSRSFVARSAASSSATAAAILQQVLRTARVPSRIQKAVCDVEKYSKSTGRVRR
jgi:hypothetical protein